MPGPLGVRCPPGTPAPRAAFSNLAADALCIIARKVSEGPPAKAGRYLANASMADRALRAAVAGDEQARWCLPLARKARQLAGSLLSEDPNAKRALLCMPVLGLLNPQEQTKLVQILLESAIHHSHDMIVGLSTFEQFFPQLVDVDKLSHAELVTWVTGYTDNDSAASAIYALGGGLAHSDGSLIDRLLDKATSLREEWLCARALRGLSKGLAHMDPNQRQRLLQAAKDIRDMATRDGVELSLCAQLEHLPPDKRDRLFEWALDFPKDSRWWPDVVTALAASAKFLTQSQQETLLTNVLDCPALPSNIVSMNTETGTRALAANMEHLHPDQRLRLVDWALQHFTPSTALDLLGSGIKHMAPHQQDRLLETAVHLSPREKRDLISDFATALPSLEPASRGKVVALALGIVNDDGDHRNDYMARAMGALGPHLEHLEEGHRNTVAGRALDILKSYRGKLKLPMSDLRELAVGLGTCIGALREDLRNELVNAVAAFDANPDLFRDEAPYVYRDYVQTIAGVIAGLASGRQHLSGPQFQTLIDAASRLEERIEQARGKGRVPPDMCDEMKAKLIFGLATA